MNEALQPQPDPERIQCYQKLQKLAESILQQRGKLYAYIKPKDMPAVEVLIHKNDEVENQEDQFGNKWTMFVDIVQYRTEPLYPDPEYRTSIERVDNFFTFSPDGTVTKNSIDEAKYGLNTDPEKGHEGDIEYTARFLSDNFSRIELWEKEYDLEKAAGIQNIPAEVPEIEELIRLIEEGEILESSEYEPV